MESNSKFQELEKQLELRDSNIASLKRTLEQKEQLLLATQEKLEVLELKKVEFEDQLFSLTQECDLDDIDIETDNVEDTVDTFVSSNSRAAQLESENRDIRIKFATLSTLVQEFCSSTKNMPSFSNAASHSELKFRKISIFKGQKKTFFLHFQKYKNTFLAISKMGKKCIFVPNKQCLKNHEKCIF